MFILFCIVAVYSSTSVYAANLIISPSTGSYKIGETFSVNLYVSSNQDPINAVSAGITFSTETLELTSIKKIGSIITLWTEDPTFSNTSGRATLEGAILNPGFSGSQGKIVSLHFRVKKKGQGIVTLSKGEVLANDGEATNVLRTLGNATFILDGIADINNSTDAVETDIAVPVIKSSTHPDSTAWYRSRDIVFDWNLPVDVTAVRTSYGEEEKDIPTRVYDPPVSNRSFTVSDDGVQFMHVQFKNQLGWGPVSHYRFQIDTVNPEKITATFPDGSTTYNPKPIIQVVATDTLSGIGSIGLVINGDKEVVYPYVPTNLYSLPKKGVGKHTVIVNAYDKARNKVSTELTYTIEGIDPPTITSYTKNIELTNTLLITGVTYPSATVEVTLIDKDSNSITETTNADVQGNYSLALLARMKSGSYEMKVRAITTQGAVSDYTSSKVVTFESIPILRFGVFIMNWLSVLLVIIVASTLVVATLWYSFVQFSRFKRKVRRTMLDAETTLKTNVLALRRDTEEFHTLLVKAEKKRELTKEELMILKKFKKRLDITEKEIEKKLEQIG